MKRNSQFYLAEVAGDKYLVPLGKTATEFNGIIKLNEMGSVLWNMMENEISLDELVKAVTGEYDVTSKKAEEDIIGFTETLRSAGALEIQ